MTKSVISDEVVEAAAPQLRRATKADAWDEGWQKAHSCDDPAMAGIFLNPYRSQS
jgi:hypothetical protein